MCKFPRLRPASEWNPAEGLPGRSVRTLPPAPLQKAPGTLGVDSAPALVAGPRAAACTRVPRALPAASQRLAERCSAQMG